MNLSPPPVNVPMVDQAGMLTREWYMWFVDSQKFSARSHGAVDTADRPINAVQEGGNYFDRTTGKPMWWNGSAWVQAVTASDSANSTVSVTSADASTTTGTATDSSLGAAFGFVSAAEFNNAITAINTIKTLANELKADVNTLVSDVNDLKTKLRTAGILA